jgi:hypothetical protein
MEYKLTTKSLFIMASIFEGFAKQNLQTVSYEELGQVMEKVKERSLGDIASFLLKSVADNEKKIIELMSIATNRHVQEIEKMDGTEFLDDLKGFIHFIDWEAVMGKLFAILETESQ